MIVTPHSWYAESQQGRYWHVYLNDVDITECCYLADDEKKEVGMFEVGEDGGLVVSYGDEDVDAFEITTAGDLFHRYANKQVLRFHAENQNLRLQLGPEELPKVTRLDYERAIRSGLL